MTSEVDWTKVSPELLILSLVKARPIRLHCLGFISGALGCIVRMSGSRRAGHAHRPYDSATSRVVGHR